MELKKLGLDEVKPNPYQPREKFDEEKIQELADNIKAHGMIEPIVVTPKGGKYVIVAGERRWMASKKAGLEKIYAVVKDYKNEVDIKRDSLVENEMREDLNDDEFKMFCFSLAKSLGTPYYDKGKIKPIELTKYVLYGSVPSAPDVHPSAFYHRLWRVLAVEEKASPAVKRALKARKVSLSMAADIAKIDDDKTQDDILDLVESEDFTGAKFAIRKHNFEQKAKLLAKTPQLEKPRVVNEEELVSIFDTEARKLKYSIEYFNINTEKHLKILKSFSKEGRENMLRNLRGLYKEVETIDRKVKMLIEELEK